MELGPCDSHCADVKRSSHFTSCISTRPGLFAGFKPNDGWECTLIYFREKYILEIHGANHDGKLSLVSTTYLVTM